MPAPDPAAAAIREADNHQRAGRFPEAIAAWRRALALRPEAFELWSALGAAAMRGHALADGTAAFRRAVELRPDLGGTWLNLGNALVAAGALDEAAMAYQRALEREPALVPALINLGDLELRAGRAARALDCFERARAADPAAPRVDHDRGVALQALGRPAEAAAAYRAALEREPALLESWNNLAIALLQDGQPAAALDACAAHLTAAPADRKALAYQAAALIELGRREEAARLLDFERLVMRHQVPVPEGFASVAELNDALAEVVIAHPTLAWEPADKATRGGSQTGELLTEPRPRPIAALERLIRAAVADYVERLRATLPDHPYAAALPTRWRLATWGVVLKAQGQQGPHFHPDGFVSGVYYLRLPTTVKQGADDAGCIEFGRTEVHLGGRAAPLTATLRPAEGLMLLFPSYLYHRTLPFESDEPRICIAFDALAA